MSFTPEQLAAAAAFLASQQTPTPNGRKGRKANAVAAPLPAWIQSAQAAQPTAAAPKAPKAFGGRTWTRLADKPSQYPGYPASAVFVSSTQPNQPRYIPLDLVAAILATK